MEQIDLLTKIANELEKANKLKMAELSISVIKFDEYTSSKEKSESMKSLLDEMKKLF